METKNEHRKHPPVQGKEQTPNDSSGQRIVDRLDIQLLITVILFFVSAWAYLNNIICEFTDSELPSIQMSYIFVHYVLTATLLYSIVLTAIKSYYILTTDEISDSFLTLFRLFLDSWYWILGICLIILLFSGSFNYEWLWGCMVICLFLGFKMKDLEYSRSSILKTISIFVILFPIFLSTMTSIVKNVEIDTDKPFYSFSDKVLITVNARGYACKHKLVGLSREYKGAQYYSEKGLIMMNATQIKNNEIAIGTIAPTTGFSNFMKYIYYKMNGLEPPYMRIDPNDIYAIKAHAHFTPKSVYVKP